MTIFTALGISTRGSRRPPTFFAFTSRFFGHIRKQKSSSSRTVSCVLTALGLSYLLYSSAHQTSFATYIEMCLLDISSPVIQKIHEGTTSLAHMWQKLESFRHLQQKVYALEQQNQNLILENTQLQQGIFLHKHALDASKVLFNLPPAATSQRSIQVSVIGAFSYHQPLILDSVSSRTQLSKNDCVLGKHGLLGRITHIGYRTAKVLTIFAPTSRVPVDIKGAQAIAVGTGSKTLSILHLKDAQKEIIVGDIAVTSGFGGVFPKGIPVGVITHIGDGCMELTPFDHALTHHIVTILPSSSVDDEENDTTE